MDTREAQFPYPWQRCKILHLVRHGQAMHNVEGEKNREALSSPNLFDAELSRLGLQQVAQLRRDVHDSGLIKRIELVITSPLSRAMKTAVEVFGNGSHSSPPIMAVELCRDRLGFRPCDKRRKISECQSLFPSIDFSMMNGEEDKLWNPHIRESEKLLAERAAMFLKWLWTRPEREIVVVSHGIVLQNIQRNGCSNPSTTAAPCKRFDHCERRSVVVMYKPSQLCFDQYHQEDQRVIGALAREAISTNGLAVVDFYYTIDYSSRFWPLRADWFQLLSTCICFLFCFLLFEGYFTI